VIVTEDKDSNYPRTWKWQEDEVLEGTHFEMRKTTGYDGGAVVVWEIALSADQRVSVWLEPAVLRTKVTDELRRRKSERGSPTLDTGERVRINPGAKRPSKRTAGQTVWPFPEVWFEHGVPDRSAEELLLEGAEPTRDEFGLDDDDDQEGQSDDSIPF
jgi:hypothetical protein